MSPAAQDEWHKYEKIFKPIDGLACFATEALHFAQQPAGSALQQHSHYIT